MVPNMWMWTIISLWKTEKDRIIFQKENFNLWNISWLYREGTGYVIKLWTLSEFIKSEKPCSFLVQMRLTKHFPQMLKFNDSIAGLLHKESHNGTQCDGSVAKPSLCTYQDPLWALLCGPAAPLRSQLPATGLGDSTDWPDSLSPCTHIEDPKEAGIPALDSPSFSFCYHLENETADGRSPSNFSVSLILPFK